VKVTSDKKAYDVDHPDYGSAAPVICFLSIAEATKAGNRAAERFAVADVTQSFRDNLSFMDRASGQGLQVSVDAATGRIIISVKPDHFNSEDEVLTILSQTAVVASKAVWTTYSAARLIDIQFRADTTDAFGAKSEDVLASIQIERGTGLKFVYDGLKQRVQADNRLLFCTADGYMISPLIYAKVEDFGCLSSPGRAAP